MLGNRFFVEVAETLRCVCVSQEAAIGRAADLIAGSIAGGGVVHFFGSGHSQMLCQEVFYRAGGLAAVNAILDDGLSLGSGAARTSQVERLAAGGTEPPVFLSGNLNGADTHNAALVERYRGRCGRLGL